MSIKRVTVTESVDVTVDIDFDDLDEDDMAEHLKVQGWRCFGPGEFDEWREDHGQQDRVRDIRRELGRGNYAEALHLFDRLFADTGDFH